LRAYYTAGQASRQAHPGSWSGHPAGAPQGHSRDRGGGSGDARVSVIVAHLSVIVRGGNGWRSSSRKDAVTRHDDRRQLMPPTDSKRV